MASIDETHHLIKQSLESILAQNFGKQISQIVIRVDVTRNNNILVPF